MPGRPSRKAHIFAPGRINLIGEHIDYVGGVVMPAAIHLGIHLDAEVLGPDREWMIDNIDLNERLRIQEVAPPRSKGWVRYVEGALFVLEMYIKQKLDSCSLRIESSLPQGAGLSSSSALVLGVLSAVDAVLELSLDKEELIDLSRQVEQEIVGVQGGIMDQSAILYGKKGCFLLLDCAKRSHQKIASKLSEKHTLVIIDSQFKHKLSEGDYNKRSLEAKETFKTLGIDTLDEVKSLDEERINALTPILQRRFQHLISEQSRVFKMVDCLAAGSYMEMSRIMYDSHKSLRDLYEVSCAPVDYITDHLWKKHGIGARMMGGGFGGSVIALIPETIKNGVLSKLATEYAQKYHRPLRTYDVKLSEGLQRLVH